MMMRVADQRVEMGAESQRAPILKISCSLVYRQSLKKLRMEARVLLKVKEAGEIHKILQSKRGLNID